MTDGPHSAVDPVMAEALEWVVKVNECPNDTRIQRELDKWLVVNEVNARAYRKAERVWKLTGDVPPAYPERWTARASASNSALEQAETRRLPPSQHYAPIRRREMVRAFGSLKWWLGLGGTVCAAALAGLLLLEPGLLDRADFRAGTGQMRNVTLPDGSTITLGGGSAVRVSYDAAQRRVTLLRGEAFFNVIHDTDRPFSVEAAGMTARDIGTAFDVDLEPSNLDVAVQSGAVGVTFGDAAPATLTAGEHLSIDRATHQAVLRREAVDTIAAWRAGRLVVDDMAVGDVVQQLRRYYRGYIWLSDSELNSRRISGVYDLHDPVSALKAVVEPRAGTVTEISPLILIVSSR